MNYAICFYSLLLLFLYGCTMTQDKNHKEVSTARYFTSPDEAVPIITDLLKNEDFKTLSAYYDLSGSKVKQADLESGEFFIRREKPAVSHPAGFWKYKHPFAPGFKYNSLQPTDRKGVYLVQVVVVIDQGEGTPSQVGTSGFYMIQSARGWQVLPDRYSIE
ncbi:MAG: hypothetical protein GXO86_00730 [Chlorobi bacterium]|nr:hypothetical protein [Chlorobiota bacterium]